MKWQDMATGVNGFPGGASHYQSPLEIWVKCTYAGYGGERSGQFDLL